MMQFRDQNQTVLFKFKSVVSIYVDPPPHPRSRHDIAYFREEGLDVPQQFFILNIEIPHVSLLLNYTTVEDRQFDYNLLLEHMRTQA